MSLPHSSLRHARVQGSLGKVAALLSKKFAFSLAIHRGMGSQDNGTPMHQNPISFSNFTGVCGKGVPSRTGFVGVLGASVFSPEMGGHRPLSYLLHRAQV